MTALETRMKEIETREKAATPKDWRISILGKSLQVVGPLDELIGEFPWHPHHTDPNAIFIAHSRQDIPFLLAALKVYRDALEELDCECGFEEQVGEGYTDGICTPCQALAEVEKLAEEK